MSGHSYLLEKQIQWALNKRINLIGSKGARGRPAYTQTLEDNLFEPLSDETIRDIEGGDGGELTGYPSKMQAVHSSSALGVNIFQYWQTISQPEKIAHACGFCRKSTTISKNIRFETKYPIVDHFRIAPNIDVVIQNDASAKHKVFAIECKFSEAYSSWGHAGIKRKYLDLSIWEEIPNLQKIAILISPNDQESEYLHRAQLIKHILGLKKAYGKENFRLLYLWYDTLGYEGWKHREEINRFIEIAKKDGIYIHDLSYQDLILKLAYNFRESHQKYIEYITDRYL